MSLRPAAAIVLAAGNSARMGEPKQLLPLRGTTILNQTLTNLDQSMIEEIVLVLGAHADAIRPTVPLIPRMKTVHNPAYHLGMATSLHAGLNALHPTTKSALIVLADQPFVRPDTLNQLAHHATSAPILIPTFRGQRGNPVRLDRSVFPDLFALQGDVGCRRFSLGTARNFCQ